MRIDLRELELNFSNTPGLVDSIKGELLKLEKPIETEQDLSDIFHLATNGVYRDPSIIPSLSSYGVLSFPLTKISLKDCVTNLKAAKRIQTKEEVIYV